MWPPFRERECPLKCEGQDRAAFRGQSARTLKRAGWQGPQDFRKGQSASAPAAATHFGDRGRHGVCPRGQSDLTNGEHTAACEVFSAILIPIRILRTQNRYRFLAAAGRGGQAIPQERPSCTSEARTRKRRKLGANERPERTALDARDRRRQRKPSDAANTQNLTRGAVPGIRLLFSEFQAARGCPTRAATAAAPGSPLACL